MLGNVLDTVRGALAMGPAGANEPLGQGRQFVYDHGHLGAAANSEFVAAGARSDVELETVAIPPMELTAKVPEGHEEGEKVAIAGPHGPIDVVPPKGTKPGSQFTYRLAPMNEFRVEVPPGAKPGLQIEVKRRDGVKVAIDVPPHLKPGDIFEVLPPALVVRVPDGAKGGDLVVFRPAVPPGGKMPSEIEQKWIRSRVPEGVEPGQYFAARLPMPDTEAAGGGPAAGAMGSVRRLFAPSGAGPGAGSNDEAEADKEGAVPLLEKDEKSLGA